MPTNPYFVDNTMPFETAPAFPKPSLFSWRLWTTPSPMSNPYIRPTQLFPYHQPSQSASSRRAPPHNPGSDPTPPPPYTRHDIDIDPPTPYYAQLVRDHWHPFYSTHVLYEHVGVFKEDTHEQIQNALMQSKAELKPGLNNFYARVTIHNLACATFGTAWIRQEYDRTGDNPFEKGSPIITCQYQDFYDCHKL